MKEFTFAGFIKFDSAGHFTTINLVDEGKAIDLVKKFRAIFDLFESTVAVSYYIADGKETESEIKEELVKSLSGAIHADYEESHYYYSELTNGDDYDTHLKIGGHYLIDELREHQGKYCIMKVKVLNA